MLLRLSVEQLAVAWEGPWGYFQAPSVKGAGAEQQDEEIEP
jgi:hypothetical protein